VSELKILSQERQRLQELFQGKTQLGELAFS
jgi:hypothetical protein